MARPRVEALLYPFGWVVLATFDRLWESSPFLGEAVSDLNRSQTQPVEARLDGGHDCSTVGDLADAVAGLLGRRYLAPGQVTDGRSLGHRLVTLIEGTATGEPHLPDPGGPEDDHLSDVMHAMALGGQDRYPLNTVFLRRSRPGDEVFRWLAGDLEYMTRPGTGVVLPQVPADQAAAARRRLSSLRHRRLALLFGHVSVLLGLVAAKADGAVPEDLDDAAVKAALRLALLYSPAPLGADYWGIEAREYMRKSGWFGAVNQLLHRDVFENERISLDDDCPDSWLKVPA